MVLTVIGVNRVFKSVGHTELLPLVADPFDDIEADGSVPFAEISHVVLVSSQYSCCESNIVFPVDTRSLPNESNKTESVNIVAKASCFSSVAGFIQTRLSFMFHGFGIPVIIEVD